ncbi:LPXTG cell wall anchor domain-containing protein [Limosilactobacillus sp. STM2_1]|uniref:LPXTG cell wall anchor domain-containing protein n=1 Tax=Limosilactobacillus rudii TaxID=2759755 RepID=A0A7W3UKR3_9LACO|nr:LPXTG cell wall anchor domain-containing protein [Limosilactobacillus rudii]MBB1079316.1 LPXTG cell wall anchor domain-containing protein [Limosilactobacillus rudii]MBB1097362.1 LPXTG cell wall anchor domain-containing protein [Limosilactobacillus rudii]MCD7134471.1 LPXTG cell wall anchor domain-containing protein [Limosilactobacillus rudii]
MSENSQAENEANVQSAQLTSQGVAESSAVQSVTATNDSAVSQSAEPAVTSTASQESTTNAPAAVATFTQPQVDSTITVSNPANYPTEAAKLVDKNAQGQPYYIYQIVKLDGTKINGKDAHLILSVDTADPQGANYLYVTDTSYERYYQKYVVKPNEYVDVTVSSNGSAIKNPKSTQIYRVSNTAAYTLEFNGKKITVPASVSIKVDKAAGSTLRVSPVYGLGNQNVTKYTDKVDISPENNAPAIEYIYLDKDGNYITSSKLPANVPVNGITGQGFVITNVDNYKQVVDGYYLTNNQGSLANTANGSYQGSISQFQIGQYYQKTLYNWDRTVSQTLIYELIDPQGTMNISLLRPGKKAETVTVPVNEVKTFSNGTLARNPFVPGANSVQLIYADLGKIIPVDQNGNPIAGADQPTYNNDPNDPHKAGATKAPDLTALGWVLVDPNQATINPVNPGSDTKVQYRRVVINTTTQTVTQTVQYQYADGKTEGRPELPKDNVQSVEFVNTVITNPVTGDVISDTWTPAKQFSAVSSPEIAGFWADAKVVGGNTNVTQDTPSINYVVSYIGPQESTENKTVTQTVRYEYEDGVTEGRPELPQANVQTLTFTANIQRNPETGEIISTTWSPGQNFTLVGTPSIKGYYSSAASAGSTSLVTHESGNTEYVVKYAAPESVTENKVITQTIHYQYADGNLQGRPELPKDNVQYITFTQTTFINPFTGDVVGFNWTPTNSQFTVVQTPKIDGFFADLSVAGSADLMLPNDADTYYVVNYAAPVSQIVESKDVTQTIHYEYVDGQTAGRPTLPQTDTQKLVFNRIIVTNPFTKEVISDTWSPAQNFTALATPEINGYYYNLALAGSNDAVTHESADTEYTVKYAPASVATENKTVTQTVKYEYADGVTSGRPTLPANNVQTLTFTNTITINPFTNEVISDTWSPAQKFSQVSTPTIDGYYYDQAQVGSTVMITHESGDIEYVVKYASAKVTNESKYVTQVIRYHYANGVNGDPTLLPSDNVQRLEFIRTILTNPFTNEVISDTWSPAQKFSQVSTPTIDGYYYDQAQAGNTAAVTHDSPDQVYDVYYLAPDTTTETKNISQTIRYEYADGVTSGRPTLPANNVQTLTFTQTIVRNPVTGEIVSSTWTPAQSFSIVSTPVIDNYYFDLAQAGSNQAVTHENANTEYVVKYAPAQSSTEDKKVTQVVKYEYADGVTSGRPTLPANNVQTLTFTQTTLTNPFTGEVLSSTWSPAQRFDMVNTPKLDGYYYDQAQAGSTVMITHESGNTEYIVKYAPASVATDNKTVTQTVKYEYADGVTSGRPTLPANNVQTLTFTQTTLTNPFTGEVLSSTWSPAQRFDMVNTPTLAGYYYDQAQAGSLDLVNHDNGNIEYVVKYAPAKVVTEDKKINQTIRYEYADGVTSGRPTLPVNNVQTLTFTQTTLVNPFTGEVLSSTWSPAQNFEIVNTPKLDGYYYDQAQAGSTVAITHDSDNIDYVVKYAAPKVTTETEKVTQNIKYEYDDGVTDGRPELPKDNTITVDFTHTVVTNPWTGEVIEDKWSPDKTIDKIKSPEIEGFHPDQDSIPEITISHTSKDIDYVVKYIKDEVPVHPEPDDTDLEKPTTPITPEQPVNPEQSVHPVAPVPEISESKEVVDQELPAVPATLMATTHENDVAPITVNVDSNNELVETPVEKAQAENKELPQTGEKDTTAIIGLGLVVGWMGLLGLGKRKSKN